MSNKKQSSVEWFAEMVSKMGYVSVEILEQAKAMHQQEIEEAYDRKVIGDIQNWYIRNGKHYYELHYDRTRNDK